MVLTESIRRRQIKCSLNETDTDVFERIENNMGKGENANNILIFFVQCFLDPSLPDRTCMAGVVRYKSEAFCIGERFHWLNKSVEMIANSILQLPQKKHFTYLSRL